MMVPFLRPRQKEDLLTSKEELVLRTREEDDAVGDEDENK